MNGSPANGSSSPDRRDAHQGDFYRGQVVYLVRGPLENLAGVIESISEPNRLMLIPQGLSPGVRLLVDASLVQPRPSR